MLEWDIRSVVLSIAALQAIIISILLLIRNYKEKRISDRFLVLFLLAISATMSEHIAGWLGLYEGQRLTFFPFGETFLFAPLAYLYVKSITNNAFKWTSAEWIHFIPGIFYFGVHFIVWAYPVEQKLRIINQLGEYKWFTIEGYCNAAFFTYYLYKIINHYTAYLKWLPNQFSNIDKLHLNWIRNFIVLLGLYYVVFIGFSIFSLIAWYNYDIGFWQYFVLAIIIYYTSITGYSYTRQYNIAFQLHQENEVFLTQEKNNPDSFSLPEEKTIINSATDQNKPQVISTSDEALLEPVKVLLLEHLLTQKPYLDAELSLSELANQLNKPAYIITQVINLKLGKNFNDLINGYRVNAVIEKLKNNEHKDQTLLGIAYDCGFNSKATFNRAFKKATNLSPKDFIKTI